MSPAWSPHPEPPSPTAALATGAAATALARRLLARDDAALAALRGVAGVDARLLVVLGPADALPWVDGVVYVAPAPDAPGLLLPTTLLPGVPADLLERALRRRFPDLSGPLVLLPPDTLIPLDAADPLDRATLHAVFGDPP